MKTNELLPKPINVGSTGIISSQISDSSVKLKYVKIGAGYEQFTLDRSYYFIEFASSDTKKILLPKISSEPTIFYIIRKNYNGEAELTPFAGDNIAGDFIITLYKPDQIIKLTNDSSHTWLII